MKKRFSGWIVLLAFLIPSLALSTTVVRKSVEQMTHEADAIVIGQVTASRTYFGGPGKTQILTDTTIRVARVLKGAWEEAVMVSQLGGRIGLFQVMVDGAPEFALGEEVLLFLTRPFSGQRRSLVGFWQGKFTIVVEANTGRSLAIQGSNSSPGERRIVHAAAIKPQAMTLDQALDRIHRALANPSSTSVTATRRK